MHAQHEVGLVLQRRGRELVLLGFMCQSLDRVEVGPVVGGVLEHIHPETLLENTLEFRAQPSFLGGTSLHLHYLTVNPLQRGRYVLSVAQDPPPIDSGDAGLRQSATTIPYDKHRNIQANLCEVPLPTAAGWLAVPASWLSIGTDTKPLLCERTKAAWRTVVKRPNN